MIKLIISITLGMVLYDLIKWIIRFTLTFRIKISGYNRQEFEDQLRMKGRERTWNVKYLKFSCRGYSKIFILKETVGPWQ